LNSPSDKVLFNTLLVLFQNLLKLEPIIHHGHVSKRIPRPAKIELTAAEWTVPTPGPAFAPANC
jgi:hypothetical protein